MRQICQSSNRRRNSSKKVVQWYINSDEIEKYTFKSHDEVEQAFIYLGGWEGGEKHSPKSEQCVTSIVQRTSTTDQFSFLYGRKNSFYDRQNRNSQDAAGFKNYYIPNARRASFKK